MEDTLTVKFWGVRGSHPTPGPDTVHYGGNTACLEVRAGGWTLVLDTGTGAIGLGRDLARRARQTGQPARAVLLFSHLHHDHTQGLPFFAPAFNPSAALYLYGPVILGRGLAGTLSAVMAQPAFPVAFEDLPGVRSTGALLEHQQLALEPGGPPQLLPAGQMGGSPDTVRVRCLKSYAHPGGVWIYRVEWRGRSLVYATDTEGYAETDQRLLAFAGSADLLVHDAQYSDEHYLGRRPGFPTTQGYGHSTVSMACGLARAAGARRLALFHYDPAYDDNDLDRLQDAARAVFPAAFAPREGQEIDLAEPAPALPLAV